jgi:hypothetical protein
MISVTHVRVDKHRTFQLESLNGRHHFGDLGEEGRIILKWTYRGHEGADWIHLTQRQAIRYCEQCNGNLISITD